MLSGRYPAEKRFVMADSRGKSNLRPARKRKLFWLGLFLWTAAAALSQNPEILFIPHPQESRNGQPSLAFAGDGTAWLAWPTFRRGEIRLAVSLLRAGRWSQTVPPDSSPGAQIDPQWADGPGMFEIPNLVYSAYVDGEWRVRQVVHQGAGWSEPYELGKGIHPTAAASREGIWAAWEDDGRIVIGHLNAGSRAKEFECIRPEPASAEYLSYPRLASGPGGEVWLAWAAARRGYQSIRVQRIDKPGYSQLTVDDGSGVNRDPAISVDSLGRVWIVYESLGEESVPSVGPAGTRTPVYILDRTYRVEYPSRMLRITDGKNWWVPPTPEAPDPGLMPNLICSSRGVVWLVSRSFVGFENPLRYFPPVCESLGADGWVHYGTAWLDGPCYKAPVSLAEDPGGTVWLAWAQHDRKKMGAFETPSWTHLDGPDRIALAPMPERTGGGKPVLLPLKKSEPTPAALPPDPKYTVSVGDETLTVYFGDLHQHSEFSGCGRMNGRIEQNQAYTRHVRGLDFMCTTDHGEHLNDHTWRWTQLTASQYDRPGRFVVFTGFEWTSEFDAGGNLNRGHYNAVFREIGSGDRYFSASDPDTNTPLELWEALKKTAGGPARVLTFPHHPSRRLAWVSWNYYDPEMVPLMEIVQARGSYEYDGCFQGLEIDNDAARVRGHYIRDGLERGLRWGLIGAGDHGGRQLTAVFAGSLDRRALFDSLKSRRVYATSGEKMLMDFRVNGRFMGEEFRHKGGDREIGVRVVGTALLVQVDLIRNGRVIQQWNPSALEVETTFKDREPLFRRENYYYLRALQKDGGQAWTSPVWVINTSAEGQFCFQVGGDELRVIYPDEETDFSVLMHNETEEPVQGTVRLRIPEGWSTREAEGIPVRCEAGEWRQAVFHVTASRPALTKLSLPEVAVRMELPDGRTLISPLFVVGSPVPLSRDEKAILIDARAEIPAERFAEFLAATAELWEKEK
jgi:hypothetical protein